MTNPTPTDWRALCAELMDAIDSGIPAERIKQSPLAVRVDAALAQPEPQGLTDEELYDFWISTSPEFGCADPVGFARAVLTRWGRPAIEPVPVAERLPGPGDCDAEWRCWVLRLRRVWDPHFTPTWALVANSEIRDTDYWLPHHALPVPQQEAE
jgi:hypothetical protein